MAEPIKTVPNQPNPDPGLVNVSALPRPEGPPVSVSSEQQPAAEVVDYLRSSNPELKPDSEVLKVVQVNRIAHPQQVVDAQTANKPVDPLRDALVDLPAAQAAAQGDTSSSNTWVGKVKEFVDKRIISMFAGKKPLEA